MARSTIRFTSFPRTTPPPSFVDAIVGAFKDHEKEISTKGRERGLTSDQVLGVLRPSLEGIGFTVEKGKRKVEKILRPVFFGENGIPAVKYEIDAYNEKWRCGLEVEAGRGWMGNAVYRDLILASVMVDVDHFVMAVANEYTYKSGGRSASSNDYDNATGLAETIYVHNRLTLPFSLTIIGY